MDIRETKLTEKELHCLARIIQTEEARNDVKCLYCRYAFECRKEFMQNKRAPYMPLLKKIEQITGVSLFMSPGTRQRKLLAGSWIENCPDLLEHFTSMSFEEQLDNLRSPDILRYEDNCTVQR